MDHTNLYKSDSLWILNKAAGLPFDNALPQNARQSWEPVHRLDTLTSGCLLCAPLEQAPRLRKLFKEHHSGLQKIYLAQSARPLHSNALGQIEGLVAARYRGSKSVRWIKEGENVPRGWHSSQPARHALLPATEIPESLSPYFEGSVYEITLHTGARHQIRAYFKAWEAPLVGDPLYGQEEAQGLRLHSWKLEITDPLTGEHAKAQANLRLLAPTSSPAPHRP